MKTRHYIITLALIIAAFCTGISWKTGTQIQDSEQGAAPAVSQTAGKDVSDHTGEADREVAPVKTFSDYERATIELFEEAAPSVVYITSIGVERDYWTRNVFEIPKGTGSGFVWDTDGHIVTNFHVISSGQRAQVTLADQTTWDAKLVGVTPEKDLAVLRIDADPEQLKPLAIGSSYDLQVGQFVYAIGNPFGLDQTLTTGVISALGREIESLARVPIRDVIQTDAAINPGNSGGPLLDSSGRLIGVNTQIYSPSGASAGIGFSIPVDVVRWVVPDLIEYGEIRRPVLGVELVSTNSTRRMGLQGALVLNVTRGGGAEQAGLKPTRRLANGRLDLGDLIVGVNNESITSNNDLLLALENYNSGDQVTLKLIRNERELELPVTLGSLQE